MPRLAKLHLTRPGCWRSKKPMELVPATSVDPSSSPRASNAWGQATPAFPSTRWRDGSGEAQIVHPSRLNEAAINALPPRLLLPPWSPDARAAGGKDASRVTRTGVRGCCQAASTEKGDCSQLDRPSAPLSSRVVRFLLLSGRGLARLLPRLVVAPSASSSSSGGTTQQQTLALYRRVPRKHKA